ncbi:phosphotransferase [Gordonia sp. SID5947]|uniref:phosphotransferase family protein n=1 Tax=Gordonia sp. SID5947 TaxID=2690315 RepID=UPI001370EF01|nr:phosphotransferase family protein [Gordonia sp. SID5947]MYR05770.1 phosphotransferase [Gordonia sp. SID5947]
MTDSDQALGAGIAKVLTDSTGGEIVVDEVRRLTGGASRETWAARAQTDAGERTVVLRRDPPGHGEPARMRAEAACLRAAAEAGVPVPTLIASGDDAPGIDAPFLVTDMVEGEAIARKIQRDDAFAAVRGHLARDMGRVLGLIHRTPTDTLDMLDDPDPVDLIESIYRDVDEPRPAVETGLRWLREHRPVRRPNTLVHGDFRMGNLLIDDSGIRGVLDWELAHLGDPIEDLGWLCVRAWRFGQRAPVAGIGSREDLLDGYGDVTGDRPDAAELHWWEVFGTLRWLVLSRFQAYRHLSGAEHSLELAAVGRRVCESEYDLLLALGLLDESVHDVAVETRTSTVHDRPALTEIVDLVSEALRTDVLGALPPDRGREKYLLKICLNLLGMVDREIGSSADHATVAQALGEAGVADEVTLAQEIRAGTVDPTTAGIRRAMSAAVFARLRVANPRHFVS